MAENGERRPKGARIEITAGAATDQEAAAIASAIESFLAEQRSSVVEQLEPQSGWQRAALIEGVSATAEVDYPWLRG